MILVGLDMFIYRCQKPDIDTGKVYNVEDLYGIVFKESEAENSFVSQLVPYSVKINVRFAYYNMDKIRKDFGLSDSVYISKRSADGITVHDISSGADLFISANSADNDYTTTEVEPAYFSRATETNYWCKDYTIQDFFYEHIPLIENEGYYLLSEDLIEEFNATFPDEEISLENMADNTALFYYEWY